MPGKQAVNKNKDEAGADKVVESPEEIKLREEKEAEEMRIESERIEAEKAKKDAERDEARKNKGTNTTAVADVGPKTYTEDQVRAMLKQLAVDIKGKGSDEDLDDEDAFKQKKVRLPRFQNKFIYKFENTNTDEYFPDLVVHAFDVWNDQTKRMDAWVKVVFEDDTTLSVPLYTVLTKSTKVWVDLVEVVSTDTSYATGKVERAEVKDYSQSGTGTYVKQKVTQADYSYKVRLPNGGPEVIVGKEVINW